MNVKVKKYLWQSLIGISHVICQLFLLFLWFLLIFLANILLQTGDIQLDNSKLPVNPNEYSRFFSFVAIFLGSIFFAGRTSESLSRFFSEIRKSFDALYKK